ncbi:MAG: electron transport complex protein RnfA, partial [Ruminococcus sp.]|nr:electron transport complex protein RnfA [Ruminococcus sp.]
MKTMLVILLSAMLTDNFVLSKFMGICPFLGVSKKLDSAAGMGVAVTFVMICATIVTYPIHHGILVPNGLEYLDTVVFILVIALFVQLVETAMKKTIPALYKSLGVYLPLITTNCAVLGVTMLNIQNELGFISSLFNALAAGLG